MTAPPPIRFGLVGAGVAAETHARELGRVTGASLEAVFARDPDKAAEFAARYGIPYSGADFGVLLANDAIDAVIVATPNGQHLEYATAAARAGKHVIVEKPLEITEARASAIIDVCRTAGRQLFVIYQRRLSRVARQALSDIRAGRLGKVLLANIVDNQFRPPDYYAKAPWRGTWSLEGGGCVITQSTHMIDLAQHLLGPIVRVFAQTRTAFHAIETEDAAVAVFTFAGGAMGTFSSSTAAYPGQRHLLTISGTRGSIILNAEHDQLVFRDVAGEPAAPIPSGFSFADPTDPRDYPTEGQRRQLQAIVDALRTGAVGEGIGDPGLASVSVIDALYRSAREGIAIEVDVAPDMTVHSPRLSYEVGGGI